MPTDALPYVDEHAAHVAAGPEEVWRALSRALDRAFAGSGATRYARLIGCPDHTASGPRPLAEGSTLPGFRVRTATPGRELTLEGSHRFSTYTLTFRLAATAPGRTRLSAETRATFPGFPGALYRHLVIGTGIHARLTRRLLAGVRRRAE